MVPINTTIPVDYFFKWFTWNYDNHSIGFALTKDSAYFYESDNCNAQPKLVDTIPVTSKQRKQIKKYLFSYQDICKNETQYINFSTEPFAYNLRGYYKNRYVEKRVVGDTASVKIKNNIFKILDNKDLTPSDSITYTWN